MTMLRPPVRSLSGIRWRSPSNWSSIPWWTIPSRLQPLADAGLDEQVGGSLLEHAGADAVLDVLAAAVLEHDRLDPLALEQPRERQPGRAGADDPDLRPQSLDRSSSSTRCAIANAPFAAGTPQ